MATANRKIYESCFPSMYRSSYTTVSSIPGMSLGRSGWDPSPVSEDLAEGGGELESVQGHLVAGAAEFLKGQNLLPKVGQKVRASWA